VFKIKLVFVLLFYFFLVYIQSLLAQELDKLKKEDLFKVSGGFGASAVFYDADGIPLRRDPFYWQLKANLNFTLGEISAPFSATLSQQERSFTQPYNQIGISPKYKAITTHIGYRSMSFSPYTLGGRVFLGGGIEVAPKDYWIQGSALYGRFARAVQTGGNDGAVVGIPTYERWGYGAKVRLGSNTNNLSLSFFRAKDKPNSIRPDSSNGFLAPAENLVWSLYTRQKLAKKITFDFEYAFSGYTRDIRDENNVLDNFNYYNNLGGLFSPNATTQYNKALIGNIDFAHEKYNVKLSYKRIDPEYQSMGTSFLNNDLESITASLSWKMFQKQLNITTTGGTQHNNLSKLKASTENRLALGLNLNYVFKQNLNLTANYSNFTSTVNQEQFLEIDSLSFFQVTHNTSFLANYKIGNNKDKKQDIIFSTNYQKANDSDKNDTKISNTNLGYKHTIKPISLSLFISANYNISIFQGLKNNTYGPMFTANKSIFDKKVMLTFTYNTLFKTTNGVKVNTVSNYRFSAQFTFKRSHAFSLNAVLLDRKNVAKEQASFLEKTLTIQYNYRF